MTAQREPASSSASAGESRSPFVRLTELIAGIEPGKPPINLSVGEPQHPIPLFVGPTLAAGVSEGAVSTALVVALSSSLHAGVNAATIAAAMHPRLAARLT